jgi:DNA-binding CsgD family transcriptional regulator
VLQLIAEGRSTREIATILEVSSNTIHAHRNHVMAKLNIHKQAALVRYAIKAGIAKL